MHADGRDGTTAKQDVPFRSQVNDIKTNQQAPYTMARDFPVPVTGHAFGDAVSRYGHLQSAAPEAQGNQNAESKCEAQ